MKIKINKWQKYLDDCSPALTGSKSHKKLIKFIKQEISAYNLKVEEDTYNFNISKITSASIRADNSKQPNIIKGDIFPYSGITSKEGIKSKIVFCNRFNYKKAKGKIAVFKINNYSIPTKIAFNKQCGSFPNKLSHPVIDSVLGIPNLEKLKKNKVLGAIFIWNNKSQDYKGQYLPFTTKYVDFPALWIDEKHTNQLVKISEENKRVCINVNGNYEKNADTSTIYTTIKGKNTNKSILINTHTDGINNVEENGFVGLLAIIDYFITNKIIPEYNLIFLFATGHFQIPQIGINGNQATSRWLYEHKNTIKSKIIYGVTIEHLGFKTKEELIYVVDSKKINIVSKIFNKALIVKPRRYLFFGEGEPIYKNNIPVIAYIPCPVYLCQKGNKAVDANIIKRQVEGFIKIIKDIKG